MIEAELSIRLSKMALKLIDTFTCIDNDGERYEAYEYADTIDATHMQGSGSINGLRTYKLANGADLRPLGGDKFHCQALMTEMRRA